MHRKLAQPEAEQKARHGRIARHFPAHRHRGLGALRAADGLRDELQHRRVQRIVQVRHGIVGAIDRERVLDQVVRPDRKKIQLADEIFQGQRRGRHLDHPADLYVPVVRDLVVVERFLRLPHGGERLFDLVRMGEHRNEQAYLPVAGGAQDRAELGQEHLRLGETEAYRAQAERGIGAAPVGAVDALVGSEVERPDRDRPAVHRVGDLPVGLELLVFRRQIVPVEEQELAAEEADSGGSCFVGLLHVLRQLDIGLKVDRDPVHRGRARGAQALQLLPLGFDFAPQPPIFLEHPRAGIDDQHAFAAVDDHELALPDHAARVMQAHDRGDVEAARDDGRVGGDPAEVGHEARILVLLEQDHVRGRQVVRHHDQLLLARGLGGRVPRAEHRLQHALDHLHDVLLALAQVRVVHLVELRYEVVHLQHQRPFGVAAPIADQLARDNGEIGIVEQHRVKAEDRLHLRRGAGGHARLQRGKLAPDLRDRSVEARDLRLDPLRCDLVVGDFQARSRDEVRVADRNSPGNARAVQGEARAARLRILAHFHRKPTPLPRSARR